MEIFLFRYDAIGFFGATKVDFIYNANAKDYWLVRLYINQDRINYVQMRYNGYSNKLIISSHENGTETILKQI